MGSAINGFRNKCSILESISAFSAIWPSTKGGGLRPPPFVELFVDGHMAENTEILFKTLNLVRDPFIAEPISTFRINNS